MQSEIEGDENESVGFYGRCQVHATHPLCDSGNGRDDSKVDFSGEQEWTCARTEVLLHPTKSYCIYFFFLIQLLENFLSSMCRVTGGGNVMECTITFMVNQMGREHALFLKSS